MRSSSITQQHPIVSNNTVKLAQPLPSISSVHARGPSVGDWSNPPYLAKSALSNDRLPSLPQIQSHPSGSSTSSSPRGGSFSASSIENGSAGSHTSYSASINGHTSGFKTPSPEQVPQSLNRNGQPLNVQSHQGSPYGTQHSYGYPSEGYNSMNQMQSYPDVHQSQMSAATAHAPGTAAPGGLSHYAYPPQPQMSLPGPQYGSAPSGYPPYGYPAGVPSQLPQASGSMSNPMMASSIQLPAMTSGPPAASLPGSQSYGAPHTFDHTGQIAPPGMKPRVTATLWEDEGSLCFQVEAKGVCVARREGESQLPAVNYSRDANERRQSHDQWHKVA